MKLLTKFVVVTRSHELQKIYEYLRVLIFNQLKWQQQIDHMCRKLACASFAIHTLQDVSPISTLKTIYYDLTHQHRLNGLVCWSHATKTSFKKIIILRNKIVRLMTTLIS